MPGLTQARVIARLRHHLASDDPWRLGSDPFELNRYSTIDAMVDRAAPGGVGRGLEIGCASGVYTQRFASRCAKLVVLDLLPEAIARCQQRLGEKEHVSYQLADVSRPLPAIGAFDVVVFSEVLYYLGPAAIVHDSVSRIAELVAPGGTLVFGCAVTSVARGWGYECGAEVGVRAFGDHLTLREEQICLGSSQDQCAIVASFRRRQ